MKKNITKQKAFISIFTIFFSAIIVSVLSSLYVLLVKQIEIMNLDSSSYQSLFVADSAFECALYKEQDAFNKIEDGGTSIFVDFTAGQNCLTSGDLTPASVGPTNTSQNPVKVTGTSDPNSIRSKGIFNLQMEVNGNEYCAILTTDKETGITGNFSSAPDPDTISISARSTSCSEPDTTKAIERLIEIYY